jgi:cytochrome bd-type quinol oxidase subunit 2
LRFRERAALAGSAFAALVGAHALTYLLAAPAHHDRAELLHETGHGSWTSMFIVAGAALLAGVVALSNRWASPSDRDVPLGSLFRFAWRRLVPLQMFGFVGLEIAERAFAHGSPQVALTEPVVLLGLLLQLVSALLCGVLLVLFTRLVRKLRARRISPRATASPHIAPSSRVHIPRSAARNAWNVRGPPVVSRP